MDDKVTILQGSSNHKEKSLEKDKIINEELSSRVTTVEKAFGKREYHMEQVEALKKECDNDVVDEGIKGIFDVFHNTCDHVEVFYSDIQIPQENMNPQKKVFYREIICDQEETKQDGEPG